MKLFHFLIIIAIVVYVFTGFIRHFLHGSIMPMLAVDIVIVCLFAAMVRLEVSSSSLRSRMGFEIQRKETSEGVGGHAFPLIPSILLLILFCILEYVLILSIQSTQYYPEVCIAASLRAYFLPSVLLPVGFFFAKYWNYRYSLSIRRLLMVFIVFSVLFAGVQFIYGHYAGVGYVKGQWGNPFISPATSMRNYGNEMILLVSSFFTSNKQFARFIVFGLILIWALNQKRSDKSIFYLSAVVFFGVMLSGSREAFLLYFLATFIFFLYRSRRMLFWLAISGVVITVAVVSVIGVGYMQRIYKSGGPVTYKDNYSRWEVMLSHPEDYYFRALIALPFLSLNPSEPDLIFGEGIGGYGSESKLDPNYSIEDIYSLLENWLQPLRLSNNPNDRKYSAKGLADSGLTKIIMDTGVLGLILFLSFLIILCSYLIGILVYGAKSKDRILIAGPLSITMSILLFLKSHSILSDIGFIAYSWFILGFVIFRYHFQVKIRSGY